ncbi:MAG: DUF935 family protein [Candidatus Competibacteraceae bacterium]
MFDWLKRRKTTPPPAAFAAPVRPSYAEIASTGDGRDITRYWFDERNPLPPQDPILEEFGTGQFRYDLYREVLSDWQVRSTFQQRQLALVSAEWEVEPGGTKRADKNAAAALEETLKTVGFDRASMGMQYGVFYGFAVGECLWARDGATVALDAIKVRDRRRFIFLPSGDLRLITRENMTQGEALPERKFWTFATGADHDDEPYGMGLAHWLYWPVRFKRGNVKFWLVAAEKFGSPTAVGWFPPGTSNEDRSRLLAALKAIQTDSGIILPDGMRAELLEASRASSLDYQQLCIYMDQAIAKVCLGQVMTSEAVGGQYKADVQNEVKGDLVKADADLLCESFNRGPARWLTEWNFPGAAVPRVFRHTEPEDDLNGRAERERKIFDLGYRPTLAQIEETYGGEWEVVPTPASGGREPAVSPSPDAAVSPSTDPANPDAKQGPDAPRSPAFASPLPSGEGPGVREDPTAPLVERLGAEADPLIGALLAPVRELLARSADLSEFRAGILDLYPDLDPAPFAALMAQALAVADAAGRFEITQES